MKFAAVFFYRLAPVRVIGVVVGITIENRFSIDTVNNNVLRLAGQDETGFTWHFGTLLVLMNSCEKTTSKCIFLQLKRNSVGRESIDADPRSTQTFFDPVSRRLNRAHCVTFTRRPAT